MNDAIWKAMCRALHEAYSDGLPLSQTPEHLRQSGPCPLCQHRIDPSGFSSMGASPPGAEIMAVIVCGGCVTPLMYREPGKFEPIPKKLMKRIPKPTLRFIEKSKALVRMAKNTVN